MSKNLVDVYGISEWMERLEEELEGEREDYERSKYTISAQRTCAPGYTPVLRVDNLTRLDTSASHTRQLPLLPGFSSWWPSRVWVSYTQRPP